MGSPGKVVPPAEAISRHVRPGQIIHADSGWGFPTALLYEVVRQFQRLPPLLSSGSCMMSWRLRMAE